jgi:hypothetical protein
MAAVLALLLMSSVLELRGLGEGRGPLLCNFSEETGFWGFFVGPLLPLKTSKLQIAIAESFRSAECTKIHRQAFDNSQIVQGRKHRATL